MHKDYQYTYEFLIHDCNEREILKYENYIHKNVTPHLKTLSEDFLMLFAVSNLKIRYGITISDFNETFLLTASIFTNEDTNNKIIGNILFPNSDQHHQNFDLNEPIHLHDLSLQGVVTFDYYVHSKDREQKPKMLHNEIFFDYSLFKNFFIVMNSIEINNCLEYNYSNSVTIEFLHTLGMSYWQVCTNKGRKLVYSIPKKFKEDTSISDIIYSLREIDYVFKKNWFRYEMLSADLESLVKMAKLQNY